MAFHQFKMIILVFHCTAISAFLFFFLWHKWWYSLLSTSSSVLDHPTFYCPYKGSFGQKLLFPHVLIKWISIHWWLSTYFFGYTYDIWAHQMHELKPLLRIFSRTPLFWPHLEGFLSVLPLVLSSLLVLGTLHLLSILDHFFHNRCVLSVLSLWAFWRELLVGISFVRT